MDGQEKVVAIFLHDNYARQYKHSGAWMNSFRNQCIDEKSQSVIPIVINNNNFNKGQLNINPSINVFQVVELFWPGGEGQPTLLSFDDAVTLFHEFGHGLHGMLSKVTYQRLSGTSVLKDFVELVFASSDIYPAFLVEFLDVRAAVAAVRALAVAGGGSEGSCASLRD